MKDYFIGIDAGSSLLKCAVFDRSGRQLSEASERTPIDRPKPGFSELDPARSWQAAKTVVAEAVRASGIAPDKFGGIGLSAAMVGAWVVDADGDALRPGIIWEDSRSQPIIDEMMARDPEVMRRIFDSSGSVMQQGCTLPVLAWLARHETEVLKRAAHVFGYKDFLRMKLTGLAATDRVEASVSPGDARARTHSDAMIALFGLDDWRHLLPEVRDSETVHGGLLADVAAELGLPAGLPVAIGAGDVAATVIGAGGLLPGSVTAVLGTTGMVGRCLDAPLFEPRDMGLLFTLPGHCWYRSMVNVAGTLNLDWAIDSLAPDLRARPNCYAVINDMVGAVEKGAEGVTYLPYLSESGIIAPVVDPTARAGFSGLTPRHGRPALFRAVFEGVAFAFADLFAVLGAPEGRIVLTGGGAQSPLWCQMIADVTERELFVPDGTQFGARGAALLAATATGVFPDIRTASAAMAGEGRRYSPDAASTAAYAPALKRYRRQRDAALRKTN
ncbi:FGGY-family carbohydrate kinase [Martelella sp. FLE1502]